MRKSFIALSLLFIFSAANAQKKSLTNQLIWSSREFSPEYVYSVNSMNDGQHFSALENNQIVKYSYKDFSKQVAVILDANALSEISIDDYFFNADETKVLLATKQVSIYRRSFTAEYYVVDLKTKKATQLYDKGPQMLADFSPDGTKVGFVFENNLYYKNLVDNSVVQITTDGKQNAIINGSTDWVYEEEFEITKAFYWSPDGLKIAYLKFDESAVKEFTMQYYEGGTYPNPYTFKYPKAGEDNSKLSLHIYDLSNKKNIEVDKGNAEYIPRMRWTNEKNELVYLTMNRHQNELNYNLVNYSASGGAPTKSIYTDKSETYVEVDNNLIFLKDGKTFLRTSEKDGFKHIYQIGFDGTEKQITKGNWDVIDLKGIDETTGTVYYQSAEEGAIYQALYAIKLDGSDTKKLSEKKGHNDAEFSTGMKYYINYYSNANQPYEIAVHSADGKKVTTLIDNKNLAKTLSEYDIAKQEFITIKGV